jgi:hypothetical protein
MSGPCSASTSSMRQLAAWQISSRGRPVGSGHAGKRSRVSNRATWRRTSPASSSHKTRLCTICHVASTAIGRAEVESNPYPMWWRANSTPPPARWTYVIEEFTGDDSVDEWALAAAIFIAQVRKRTSQGPTFKELFTELLPDTNGHPGPLPDAMNSLERKYAINHFRIHAALVWHRQGMISWENGTARSLRVGRLFWRRARAHRRPDSRAGVFAAPSYTEDVAAGLRT